MNTRTFVAISIGGFTSPIIDASGAGPNSPMQVIYIPIRTWSDGTPAVNAAAGM
jgi:hypothetical protein